MFPAHYTFTSFLWLIQYLFIFIKWLPVIFNNCEINRSLNNIRPTENVIIQLEFTYVWSNLKFAAIILNSVWRASISVFSLSNVKWAPIGTNNSSFKNTRNRYNDWNWLFIGG